MAILLWIGRGSWVINNGKSSTYAINRNHTLSVWKGFFKMFYCLENWRSFTTILLGNLNPNVKMNTSFSKSQQFLYGFQYYFSVLSYKFSISNFIHQNRTVKQWLLSFEIAYEVGLPYSALKKKYRKCDF